MPVAVPSWAAVLMIPDAVPRSVPGTVVPRVVAATELQVALGTVFSRLPGLHIAVPENELTWQTGIMMRGLAAFPVAW